MSLSARDFLNYSYVAIDSLLDFQHKAPLEPKRFAALGKLRGLRIARGLQTRLIDADDALAECRHSFGFTSVSNTMRAYQELVGSVQQPPA